MQLITTTDGLARFCETAATHPFVTVDTEFLRERTYYAQLCLVQLAMPGKGNDGAVLVDSLAPGLDLAPLFALFANTAVVKVFHAARQDLEIIHQLCGRLPEPLFDTQVAAMVCGFGEQVGYETLVREICRADLDKTARFTDWSQRPLSERQMVYALADVTHLRDIYLHLSARLQATGRSSWLDEEIRALTDASSYFVTPDEAWLRVKTRTTSGQFLAVVRELARFREALAQSRNIPRARVFKDDVLLELAAMKPRSLEELSKSRLLLREARRGDIADGIIAAVGKALALDRKEHPKPDVPRPRRPGGEALADLLRVLLKARADQAGVAQKLIATVSQLDDIAAGDVADSPVLKGWRLEVFGADALRLCDGEIALSAGRNGVVVVEIPSGPEAVTAQD
jgi:ribonuclease D